MSENLIGQKKAFTFEELLRFYQESGVDIAILDEPINRLIAQPALTNVQSVTKTIANQQPLQTSTKATDNKKPPVRPSNNARKTNYVPLDDQIKLAREVAMRANSLDELRQNLTNFDDCPLKITAKNTCFADGSIKSKLMVIGDVPEREEDLQGLPFVGPSGDLLNKMLAAIGFNREDVYIANVIAWRPPGNREPTPHEVELCKPFIYRQIELANPDIILAFGGTTTTWLTGVNEGILRMRGNWLKFVTSGGKTIGIMPTFHPRYLLRNPLHKKFTWQDLLSVKMKMRELSNEPL
ncbi:uracil-DNA glycosylase [Bartonella sp. HY329]|uniref:uracil-DNA glycosylase n=1 Tax=unclassified Bartonella TaxID=2645622 RepID=UPI0021C9D7D5|nr:MULTISPECIES: uracil-DNA glycosylase [unclassified Bartonella]UXM93858.1 uracil-DNA glycosylase [Bartonella sp. HY329]UXN08179.1 uracil-DNA glycosylase [Bartonella sp. HY328]